MSFSVYDFRDLDLMLKLSEQGSGATARDLSIELGGEDGSVIAARLTWMQRFGMVHLDQKSRLWSLSPGGDRVVESKLRAAAKREIEAVPDESLVEVMAHVTSRYRHGDTLTAAMLRREFLFGTKRR